MFKHYTQYSCSLGSPLHVIVRVLIVRGRETSREGRRWVDALARAAVGLNHKLYILARVETAWLVSMECIYATLYTGVSLALFSS